jgi:hypothetical protein
LQVGLEEKKLVRIGCLQLEQRLALFLVPQAANRRVNSVPVGQEELDHLEADRSPSRPLLEPFGWKMMFMRIAGLL